MITDKHIGHHVNTPDGEGILLYILPDWDMAGKPVALAVKNLKGDVARVKFLDRQDEPVAEWYAAADCSPKKTPKGYFDSEDGLKKITNSTEIEYTTERCWRAFLIEDGSIVFRIDYKPTGQEETIRSFFRLSQKTMLLLHDFIPRVSFAFEVDTEGIGKELNGEILCKQKADLEQEINEGRVPDNWCVKLEDCIETDLKKFLFREHLSVGYYGMQKGVQHYSMRPFGILISNEQFLQIAHIIEAASCILAEVFGESIPDSWGVKYEEEISTYVSKFMRQEHYGAGYYGKGKNAGCYYSKENVEGVLISSEQFVKLVENEEAVKLALAIIGGTRLVQKHVNNPSHELDLDFVKEQGGIPNEKPSEASGENGGD